MDIQKINNVILRYYPELVAVYLFGSYGTPEEWPDSDVDLALLLPGELARKEMLLGASPCQRELETLLSRQVDLINVSLVSTVFQNEIMNTGRIILVQDEAALHHFEMRILSAYQKLNEERAEIMEAFQATGRAYDL